MTDKGQLLSDEQIMAKFCKGCNMSKECAEEQTICLDYKATLKERKPIVQAQRDLTASIYEQKIRELFQKIRGFTSIETGFVIIPDDDLKKLEAKFLE